MNDDKIELEKKARFHFAQGDFAGAETLFAQLAQETPDNPLALYNWGVTLGKLDRFEQAADCYRKTLTLNPVFTDAYINLGTCLNELGLVAQARQGFALARQVEPDNPVPIINEGITALALGDYQAGWQDFSARWRLPAYAKFKRDFPKPYWQGEDLAGKTLFLFAEQGFGDTIQMARYVPIIARRGARIIIEAPPALARLLRSLEGDPQIIVKGEVVPDFDFYCAMMDIPRACGTLLETIPAQTPYVFPAAADSAQIPARGGKKRIGLSWAGRTSHENDRNRSLRFTQLAPLLVRNDYEWISLQRVVYDHDSAPLAASKVQDWGRNFEDFAAAAAAIAALDLVITVDTAIAHLAGALGKEVWILLPFYADWRWLTQHTDSPWYPTACLFRQQKRRVWDDVLTQIAVLL